MFPTHRRRRHAPLTSAGKSGGKATRRREAVPFRPRLEVLEDRRLLSGGALDPTFGNGGQVITDFPGGFATGTSVALQPDGKILVAGFSAVFGQPNTEDFALVRYNTDGSLDTSFGNGGRVTTDFFGFNDEAHTVLVQPDGKIVVEGEAIDGRDPVNTIAYVGLARYLPDGSLDSSFGNGGKVTASDGVGNYVGSAALQADGKIVVLGTPGLLRFNTDGSPDTAFDSGAGATAGAEIATAFAMQPDGKFVTAGYYTDLGTGVNTIKVWRVNPDGSLDDSYGQGGVATITSATGFGTVSSVAAVQADGKFVLALPSQLLRLDTTGQPDSTFGTGGFGADLSFVPEDLVEQADGKLLVAGDLALQRVNPDGSPDTGFGTNGTGVVSVLLGGVGNLGPAVVVQPDGKIVEAGGYNDEIVVARFLGTGSLSPGVLQFSTASASVPDTDGGVILRVTRTGGSDGTVTAQYATSDGTAQAGVDYQPASGTLTFGPGQTQQLLSVNLLNDGAADSSDETFDVTLTSPTGGATLGTPDAVVITIDDTNVGGGGGGGGSGGGSGGGGSELPPLPPGTDLSALVGIQVGRAGAKGGPLRRTVTITNTSGDVLPGPFWLVLDHLSPRIKLRHGAGTAHGGPFLTVNVGAFDPGASLTLTLNFGDPTGRPIRFTPDLLVPE